jgi:glycosyltransferase involved in cell wall biosynthesis
MLLGISLVNIEFSVIICTLNRKEQLLFCVNSLLKQIHNYKIEIIIIDQSEKKSDISNISNSINYIHSEKKGLSLNRNIGIRASKGNIICIMDDDAYVSNNYFNCIINFYKKYENIDIGVGIIKNIEDNKPFSRYMSSSIETNISLKNFDRCLSSAMFFKREVFFKINGFDTLFGIGSVYGASEEADFLINSLLNGFKAHSSSKVIVYHPKFILEDISNKNLISKGYNYGIGRGALIKKYSSKIPIWSYYNLISTVLKSLIGIFYFLIIFDKKKVNWYFNQFKGRLKGFSNYKADLKP